MKSPFSLIWSLRERRSQQLQAQGLLRKKIVLAASKLLFLLITVDANAQTTLRADRFTFNIGPCVMRSGSGSPEGVVTGNVCDQWHRTDSPYGIYTKRSGSGNTGWLLPASTDLTDTANLAYLNAATNAFTSAMTIGTTLGVTGTITGNLTGNVTGNVSGTSGSTTGNAATATALQNARTIAGVSFNGTANIAIPSTGLSDTANLPRLNTVNSFTDRQITTAAATNGVAVIGINTGTGLAKGVYGEGAYVGVDGYSADASGIGVRGTGGSSSYDFYGNGPQSLFTGLVNANGGIAVDSTNFTVSGTTGAIATTALASLTTPAESWVGPSTTNGVYFKSGNVGIGTITPTFKLDVAGRYRVVATAEEYSTAITRSDASSRTYWLGVSVGGSGGHWQLSNEDGTALVNVAYAGNVGINDTTPDARLEVVGGDIGISTQGNGLILKATDGSNCYRLTVNNAGTLATASVTCP